MWADDGAYANLQRLPSMTLMLHEAQGTYLCTGPVVKDSDGIRFGAAV